MPGEVHLVTGCMFAGKTTHLLEKAARFEPHDVLVVKHAVDTRYVTTDHACTHDGVTMPCVRLCCLNDVCALPAFACVSHVMVDEGQFFPDLADAATKMCETHGKLVTVAALSSDHQREPFAEVARLASLADSVERLYARCVYCSQRALFSRKKDTNTPTTVGGSEQYEPVCRMHFPSAIQK